MLKATAVLVLLFACISCNNHQDKIDKNALFQLTNSAETGITFNNRVKDTKELNIFNFRNFYNGAGVSIGDINNDGLPDIFFTANQGENKLYINNKNGAFTESAALYGLDISAYTTQVSFFDYDLSIY